MYATGLVVIPRRVYGSEHKKRTPAYTLHRDACCYVMRSNRQMPAPLVPYEGTIACTTCKPPLVAEA
jgi:hypothetical protein